MSLLHDLENEFSDYAKSMPDSGMAEDSDFKAWGQGFCERMVHFLFT
jgi:hypothetical protein